MNIPKTDYDKYLAEECLKDFIELAWGVVEPSNPYVPGWHIDAIAEHLEAVSKKQISKLIINIPPRHMKSLLVAVFWPAWEWIHSSSSRFLFTSYAEKLSLRDSRKCRNIIKSKWYQDKWSDRYSLVGDQDAKQRYDTDKTGYRIATSVGGVATGEGGDYVVCLPYDTKINVYGLFPKSESEGVMEYKRKRLPIGYIVEKNMVLLKVLSSNMRSVDRVGELEYKEIEACEKSDLGEREIIKIETSMDIYTLECTEDHPVFVEGKGFIPAGAVGIKDKLIRSEYYGGGTPYDFWRSEYYEIKRISRSFPKAKNNTSVYNIRVKDNHNYFANNILVHNCDDAHSALEALSETKRIKALEWWDETMTTREDTPGESAKIIIMQRLHEKDLSGHLLAKNIGYEHLCLPAEYEGVNRCDTSLNFTDPRIEPNEPLHPGRYGREQLEELKKGLKPYTIAGQLQQRPAPLKGGLMELGWFGRYTTIPDKTMQMLIVQVWDTAQKEKESIHDPWVCGTWYICYDGYYLAEVYRKWMNYPDGKKAAINMALKYNPDIILIEDKVTGTSLLQELPLEQIPVLGNGSFKTFPYSLLGILPDINKQARMERESCAVQAGRVKLPHHAPWLTDFELEASGFPNSEYKDQVDMLSMFLRYMRERMGTMLQKPEAFGNSVAGKEYHSILEECGTTGDRRGFDGGIV